MELDILDVNCMFEEKNKLKVVLEEKGQNDLAASEWKMLQSVINILQSLARLILLSEDEYTTLVCAVPAIVDLNIQLEEECLQ